MTNLTNNNIEERVKDLFFTDGYFHIDLFDGMRLSGPIRENADSKPGKSRLVETGPSSNWHDDMSLDHLVQPAA
ncbi:MAG: hypothetical protein ACJ8LG_02530 [Massilia sp.]